MIDLNDYRENGFVLLKGFFPAEEVVRIYSDAKDVFTRYLAAVQHVTSAVDTMLDKVK